MNIWIMVAAFFLVLALLVTVNAKVNGGFKIETSWIAIALSPAIIWLLANGQIQEFSGFGLNVKLKEASQIAFSWKTDGDKIEPDKIITEGKAGQSEIPEFIDKHVVALSFQLMRTGYYDNAVIKQYLDRLTAHDFFRFVIFLDGDGKLRGLIPARELRDQIQEKHLDLVDIIEKGELERISRICTTAVAEGDSKRDALKKMGDLKLSELPVVNDTGEFIGIVERDKMVSSILLQLITQS